MNMKNKSTGPKTEKGKAISKYNSLKHGLLSKEVLIDGEDEKILSVLSDDIHENLKPVGAIEALLVERIVSGVWRLRRALSVEATAMEYYKDCSFPMLSDDPEKKSITDSFDNEVVEKIIRYETTIERSIYKALHELERVQARRNGNVTPLPSVLDVNVDTSDGFVS